MGWPLPGLTGPAQHVLAEPGQGAGKDAEAPWNERWIPTVSSTPLTWIGPRPACSLTAPVRWHGEPQTGGKIQLEFREER
jgi:hypothetical protein